MTNMTANIAAPRMMLVGGGTVAQVAEVLQKFSLARPLVVSDPFMVSSGMIERCLGHDADARAWFTRALTLNPHFSVLWAPVARRLT